ncbi:hypothetical protein CHS0354_031427 [Potamilus streckersoni]|uniref:Uncharacterized protein n=1 Tax=Potamilus streckersoni TaxID=2493646 RepID=A0AAE0RUJ9_9BIVA|nr:hypothetical protein CHS0354_031427 [Potamilus streckersoni]
MVVVARHALSDAMLNRIARNDRRNVSLKKTKVDAMLQSTRKILRELYYPFNVDLSLLLHDNKYLWDVDIEV